MYLYTLYKSTFNHKSEILLFLLFFFHMPMPTIWNILVNKLIQIPGVLFHHNTRKERALSISLISHIIDKIIGKFFRLSACF